MIKDYLYPEWFLKPTGLTYEQFIKEQGLFMQVQEMQADYRVSRLEYGIHRRGCKIVTSKSYKSGKTWPVGAKKYAISAPSAAIALRYGKNVSRGIGMMDEEIKELKKEIKELKKK